MQLVVTTGAAFVMVMAVVPALVVVHVCTQLGLRLVAQATSMALIVHVIGVLAMSATGLEALVLALRETLLVIALDVTATAINRELVLLVLAMLTVTIVAIIVSSVRCMAPALVGETLQLARELLFQLAAHLVLCLGANFLELMVLQAAVILASLMDQLELFCKSLESLSCNLHQDCTYSARSGLWKVM